MVARNYIDGKKNLADEIKILLVTTIAFLTDDLKPSKPRENNVFNVLQTCALFAWLISRTFSTNEQYFSLTTNQPTVLSVMAY